MLNYLCKHIEIKLQINHLQILKIKHKQLKLGKEKSNTTGQHMLVPKTHTHPILVGIFSTMQA